MSNVLPGVADVLANLRLLVSMLIRLDLPTFERPMKAYSGFVSLGHIDTMGALSENSACLISIRHLRIWVQRYKKITNYFVLSTLFRIFAVDFSDEVCFHP